jgi:alpha-L-fucosidase 2
MSDRDKPNDEHRHLSHMIAVHPGRQISPITTPKFAEAARVSMNARGDGQGGWSKAWKSNIWARLHDGDRAYKLAGDFLKNNIFPNLWGNYWGGGRPPFQIECNFGYASGLCEMLMQSHMGVVHLLPALPAAWKNGKVTGMKARGCFVVDMEWKDGSLTEVKIESLKGAPLKVRYGDKVIDVKLKKGETKTVVI